MNGRRVAYLNARLLDPASGLDEVGGLLTEGGMIADLGPTLFNEGVPGGADIVDCEGACLAPGLIDICVTVGEPGAEHKETFETAGQAAAAGGVTTFISLPITEPVIDDVALVEYVHRRASDSSPVRIYPMAAATKGRLGERLTEIGLLSAAGAIAFGDGDRAIANASVMRRLLSYASAHDALIVQHVEEAALADEGVMNESEVATRLGLAGIPVYAETVVVERDEHLVAATGARYHAQQLSTAGAIDVLRRAKAQGLDMTAGTAPHYFALNETAVGEYRTFAKTSPPLRSEADRLAVVEGLADGTIDIICSAHCPQDPESKRQPFAQAAFGVVGLETLLAVSLELYHRGALSLLALLAKLTVNPAERLKLESGRLARGRIADLTLFDPDQPWRVDAAAFRSKSKNSAFDERPVQGRILRTVVGGEAVYRKAAGDG